MPDPMARKRLKKKMLDRWENEGGSITSDTASADGTNPTSENTSNVKKRSSRIDHSTAKPKSTKKGPATRK